MIVSPKEPEIGGAEPAHEGSPDGYSIRVASRLTGISAHTLRMWERRYGFPVPDRTGAGARRYSAEDVASLKLIARALDAGYRPHEVVGKPRPTLEKVLADQVAAAPAPRGSSPNVARVIDRIVGNDLDAVRGEVRAAVAVLGPKRFLTDFAHPLVVAIGEAWEDKHLSVQQEHWASELLTTQLRALMAGYEGIAGRPAVLLTTLPGELHALGLQMVALHLSLSGASARLLGPNVPIVDIAEAARCLGVEVVGISVPAKPSEEARAALERLLVELPRRVEMWVGGSGAAQLGLEPLGVRTVETFEQLDQELARWRAEA